MFALEATWTHETATNYGQLFSWSNNYWKVVNQINVHTALVLSYIYQLKLFYVYLNSDRQLGMSNRSEGKVSQSEKSAGFHPTSFNEGSQ